MTGTGVMARWKKISRRIRVPSGFTFLILYFWLAHPAAWSLAASLALVVPGILLRGYASGYVKKNAELTMSGPYAHTRNPLYLGSILIGFGFALAARSFWIAVALAILFVAIYWPVILGEEEYLRAHFADFDAYALQVPRLIPHLKGAPVGPGGGFSGELYRKHREYNALLGSLCVYAALVLLVWIGRAH